MRAMIFKPFISYRKHKVDPRENKRGAQKLLANGESIKHILSLLDTANCYIESLFEGIDFSTNVTRARFDNEIGKVS
jgi:molecular chaperone DnaK (HSP70)